jgi:hypothetical protein
MVTFMGSSQANQPCGSDGASSSPSCGVSAAGRRWWPRVAVREVGGEVRRVHAKEGVERDVGRVVPCRRHSSLGCASQVGVIKPRTNRSVYISLN